MIDDITGLHHVTSIASDARAVDTFFTHTLGLRRVKKTVNFDAPEVYHLYYGDAVGTPGGVMTYFPFEGASPAPRGHGETAETRFAVPRGAAPYWAERLGVSIETGPFGDTRVAFATPDGERLALIEAEDDRAPWDGGGIDPAHAIRGFHSVALQVADAGPTEKLLTLMGYKVTEVKNGITRLMREGGTAGTVDVIETPDARQAGQGAGSVHHVAFSVPDRAAQERVRMALTDEGFQVTPQIDREYFYAIYFRTPGGILFEVATAEPGFDRDEDRATLGEALKLPDQHAHLRERLEGRLPVLD